MGRLLLSSIHLLCGSVFSAQLHVPLVWLFLRSVPPQFAAIGSDWRWFTGRWFVFPVNVLQFSLYSGPARALSDTVNICPRCGPHCALGGGQSQRKFHPTLHFCPLGCDWIGTLHSLGLHHSASIQRSTDGEHRHVVLLVRAGILLLHLSDSRTLLAKKSDCDDDHSFPLPLAPVCLCRHLCVVWTYHCISATAGDNWM